MAYISAFLKLNKKRRGVIVTPSSRKLRFFENYSNDPGILMNCFFKMTKIVPRICLKVPYMQICKTFQKKVS